MTRSLYIRSTDGAEMIEVAPHQYVNAESATRNGLVSHHEVSDARFPPFEDRASVARETLGSTP